MDEHPRLTKQEIDDLLFGPLPTDADRQRIIARISDENGLNLKKLADYLFYLEERSFER